ncbi:MAG: hypothetical protein RL095_2016 [Verrucomicrobiota bacterium]|jgi:hypothetical protein
MKKPVKILLFTLGGGALALGGLLAWAASDSFFRSQVLERASAALGTPVRAGGVDWAPTSGLELQQLSVGEGDGKLLTADKVKLSWNLMPLLSKRLEVNEVTLSQAEIFLALDSEGKPKNLPKPKESAEAPAAKDEAPQKGGEPSSPPDFCIKSVKLERCKLTVTRDGAPGQPGSSFVVKDFSLDLPLLSPGQDFQLAIAAALTSEGQGLGLKVEKCGLKVSGGLSADLKPLGLKIEGELAGMSSSGKGMPDLAGRRFACSGTLDFKDGKLDLGKDGLLFQEELGGVSGASLRLAGALDTVKKEGEIRCEVRKLGASLLSLAAPFVSASKGWQLWQKSLQDVGAPAGFGETDIAYSGKIVLAGAAPLQAQGDFTLENLPVVVGKGGRLQAAAASVRFNHDLSFDPAAKALALRQLGASASVGNQELISLVMPKPCGLDLNTGRLSGEGARIALEVKNLDLGIIAPLAQSPDFSLKSGRFNLSGSIAAAADGKIETAMKSRLFGLSFVAAGENIKDFSFNSELKASLAPDLSLDAPLISADASLAGQPALRFSAHASRKPDGLLELGIDKFQLEHALTQLLPAKIRDEIAIENFNLALEDAGASFDGKSGDAAFKGVFVTKRCTAMKTGLPAVTLSQFLLVDAKRSGAGAISLKQLVFGLETRQGLDSLLSCRLKGSAEIPAEAFASSGFQTDKVSAEFFLENFAVQPVVRNFLPTENLQKPRFANLNFFLPKLGIALKDGVARIDGGFTSKRLIVRNPQGEDRVFANSSADFAARFELAAKHFILDSFKLSFSPNAEIAPLQVAAKADLHVGDLAAAGNRIELEFPADLELGPWVALAETMLPPQTEKEIRIAKKPAQAAAPELASAANSAATDAATPLRCAFTFKAPRILYNRQGLEQIALDAELNQDELNLKNFSFASEGKPFIAKGLFNKGPRKSVDLKIDGSLDLNLAQALARAMGKEMEIAGVLKFDKVDVSAAGSTSEELAKSLLAQAKIIVNVARLQGQLAPGLRLDGIDAIIAETELVRESGSNRIVGFIAPSHVKISKAGLQPMDVDARVNYAAKVLENGVIDQVKIDGKLSLAEGLSPLVFKFDEGRFDLSQKTTSKGDVVLTEEMNLLPYLDFFASKKSAESESSSPASQGEAQAEPNSDTARGAKALPPFRVSFAAAGFPDVKLLKPQAKIESQGSDLIYSYSHQASPSNFLTSGVLGFDENRNFRDLKVSGPIDLAIANSLVNHGKKTSFSGSFNFSQVQALSGSLASSKPYDLIRSMKGDLKGEILESINLKGYTDLPLLIPDLLAKSLTDIDPKNVVFNKGGFEFEFHDQTLTFRKLGLTAQSIMYDMQGTIVAKDGMLHFNITPNPAYRFPKTVETTLQVVRLAGDIGDWLGKDKLKKQMEKLDQLSLGDVTAYNESTGMHHLKKPFTYKASFSGDLTAAELADVVCKDIQKQLNDQVWALGKAELAKRLGTQNQKGNPAEKEAAPLKEEPVQEKSEVDQIIDLFGKKTKPSPAPTPAPKEEAVKPAPAPKEEPAKEKSDVEQIIDLFGKKKRKAPEPAPAPKEEPAPAPKEEPAPPKKEEPAKQEKSAIEQGIDVIDLFNRKRK